MNILNMSRKEIFKQKGNFFAGVIAVILAVGIMIVTSAVLTSHDTVTEVLLKEKREWTAEKLKSLENDMRKAMLKLSFNLLILPREQKLNEWYTKGYSEHYMPDDYAHKLVNSEIVLVRHLLPILQQKIEWPEKKRKIILVGTRGEVPNIHKAPKKAMVQAVPEGKIVLGYELHQSLGLKKGDTVTLMGASFDVHTCYGERGSKDDITAWISLKEAQKLLKKEGKINAILALECVCAGDRTEFIGKVRAEIMGVLPDTQVIEQGTKALVRAEARLRLKARVQEILSSEKRKREELRAEREQFASVAVPLLMILSALLIGFLMYFNVRDRQYEIGILRAIGVSSGNILVLFLSRTLFMGIIGGILGVVFGSAGGVSAASFLDGNGSIGVGEVLDGSVLIYSVVISLFLPLLAGWIPSLFALSEDPAVILRRKAQ